MDNTATAPAASGGASEIVELQRAADADSAYLDGLCAGWNFGIINANKEFDAARAVRMKEISRARRRIADLLEMEKPAERTEG